MKHLRRTITKQLFLRSRIFLWSNDYQTLVRHSSDDVDGRSSERPTGRQKFVEFVPFNRMVQSRREEAGRSIVVQVKDRTSYEDLITYCQSFGKVKNAVYYSAFGNDLLKHFIVIEYENECGAKAVLRYSKPSDTEQVLPVTTPFLWFCSGPKRARLAPLPPLRVEPNALPLRDELEKLWLSSNSFDEDVLALYERTKLGNIGTRLRFVTALQLEKALSGLFATCRVLPFGSSINTFGKLNCDLDLALQLHSQESPEDSRLIYASKTLRATSRLHNQRHMETIADMLQVFVPGCANTRRILKARVPIIKYTHELCGGLECDLSASNLSGVYMSELLYLYGAFDQRVRPLVFAVRDWAQQTNLTNPTPGKWVTNFMLTLLVLFHLQREKIIPTIETLVRGRRPEDERRTFVDENDQLICCNFAGDLSALERTDTVANDATLLQLLFNFFHFYSTFDFRSNALSLYSGNAIPKPFYDPMYIVNPLEKALNVSRNVSQEECDKLQMLMRTAAWSIECALNVAATAADHQGHKKWGFNDLIISHVMNRSGFPRTRTMKGVTKFAIKELFDSHDNTTTADVSPNAAPSKNVKI